MTDEKTLYPDETSENIRKIKTHQKQCILNRKKNENIVTNY